jgi:hypothetical protein
MGCEGAHAATLRRGGECQPMAPAFKMLLMAMAALVAFGAAAAIALLGSRRAGLARTVLTIIAVALLVLAGAAACVLAH